MRPGPASLPLALFACVIHPTSFLPTEPPSSPSPLPRPGWGVEEAGELGMALPLGWLTVLGVPPLPPPRWPPGLTQHVPSRTLCT